MWHITTRKWTRHTHRNPTLDKGLSMNISNIKIKSYKWCSQLKPESEKGKPHRSPTFLRTYCRSLQLVWNVLIFRRVITNCSARPGSLPRFELVKQFPLQVMWHITTRKWTRHTHRDPTLNKGLSMSISNIKIKLYLINQQYKTAGVIERGYLKSSGHLQNTSKHISIFWNEINLYSYPIKYHKSVEDAMEGNGWE